MFEGLGCLGLGFLGLGCTVLTGTVNVRVCVCVCVRVLIFNAVFDFCQGPKLQGLEGKSLGPGHPQSAVL